MTLVWLAGEVLPGEQARVAALDHGLTVGDGVFETCKVVTGQVFSLTRHLRRLTRSAELLGLAAPDQQLIADATAELLAAAGDLPFARLRITCTSGAGPLGSDRGAGVGTVYLAVTPAKPWPDHIEAVSVPWPRNERSAVAGVKTTSYAENVVALAAAHRAGGHEAILSNTLGNLCEGTGSNVVVELDGELLTPPLSAGPLAGITRELLLEWAKDDDLPLREADVPMAELGRIGSMLLTSSTRDVQPVNVFDGRVLPMSDLAQRAHRLFATRAAEGIDP